MELPKEINKISNEKLGQYLKKAIISLPYSEHNRFSHKLNDYVKIVTRLVKYGRRTK